MCFLPPLNGEIPGQPTEVVGVLRVASSFGHRHAISCDDVFKDLHMFGMG